MKYFFFQAEDEATDIGDWCFTGDLFVNTFHKDLHMRLQKSVIICWQEAETDPDSAILTLGGLWQSYS